MRRRMKKTVQRILAMLLVFVLAAGMLPVEALAGSTTNPDDFTVTVKENEAVITDVTVAYDIKVNDASMIKGSVTAADGISVISDMADYAEQIAGETDVVKIAYTVTKDGYNQTSSEEIVTEVNGNIDVQLTKIVPETVTVTVTSNGNGIVKLDGSERNSVTVEKGSSVYVELIPKNATSYIKSLKINEQNESVEKYQSFKKEITADTNQKIEVTFVTEYRVMASENEGGSITLDGKSESQKTVDENTKVKVTVKANEGYQIETVSVGGEEQNLDNNKNTFEDTITVTKDTEVVATFVKVYTITVKYDSEKGKITQPPLESTSGGGKVTVKNGEEFSIIAKPNDNYRVSQVKKNGNEVNFEGKGNNDATYKDSITNVNKDYEYEITFALNRFDVEIKVNGTSEMGEVTHTGGTGAGSFQADYNSQPVITIEQHQGYHVSSVIVDRTEKLDALSETGENAFSLTLGNVTSKVSVQVTFEQNKTVNTGNDPLNGEGYSITFENVQGQKLDVIREYTSAENQKVYILPKNTEIKILPKDNYTHVQINGENSPNKSVQLTETKIISCITVSKGNKGYITPKNVSMNIKLVVDKECPEIEIEPAQANENGYHNNDVTVSIKVSDNGEYSGIAKVEYRIVNINEQNEEVETCPVKEIYSHKQGEEILSFYPESITVEAQKNNSADVRVYVKVTDLAGNTYSTSDEEACKLKICIDEPTVKVEIYGEKHPEAEDGYYNKERKATITITDRSDVFDEKTATNAISVYKRSGNKLVKQTGMLSAWEDDKGNKNIHKATITFADDGEYQWEVASYKNKADLCSENIVEKGSEVYSFVIDQHSPLTEDTVTQGQEPSRIKVEETGWSKLATTLTFGVYQKDRVTVTAVGKDALSPVKAILYYKTGTGEGNNEIPGDSWTHTPLNADELEALCVNGQFTDKPYEINADEKFVVYARITDYAGNTVYISTDGVIVDLTPPNPVEIQSVTESLDENKNLYNGDVKLSVKVQDPEAENKVYSGIKSIKYQIESKKLGKFDNNVVKGELYTFTGNGAPINTWESQEGKEASYITVKSEEFNTDDIVVTVTVTDNAGHETTSKPFEMDICTNKPSIKVEFDSYTGSEYKLEEGYFDKERTATITVTDRNDVFYNNVTFNPSVSSDGIPMGLTVNISAVDGKNDNLNLDTDKMISSWTNDGDQHKATITFSEDANYTWSVSYVSQSKLECHEECGNSGCTSHDITYTGMTPKNFTVDKMSPTDLELKMTGEIIGSNPIWVKLLNVLTFGRFSQKQIKVDASAKDATSPILMEYYKTDRTAALNGAGLDALYAEDMANKENDQYSSNFKKYDGPFDIPQEEGNEQFVVYLKVTDYAGNYEYISSNGYVVDRVPSEITLTSPTKNTNGIYSQNVEVDVKVTDPKPYAGIKKITYSIDSKILRDTGELEEAETGTLYTFESREPEQSELKGEWDSVKEGKNIIVDALKFNSSDVTVSIYVEDNAGNTSSKSLILDIDMTVPVIEVSYDNNKDNNGNGYFNAERTATVKITERSNHFEPGKATDGLWITADDVNGTAVKISRESMINGWQTRKSDGNPDEDIHTATIRFSEDANYTLYPEYTDRAGHKATSLTAVADTAAPWKFTVDKTKPKGTVKATAAFQADKDGKKKKNRKETWDDLIDSLSFGFWANESITVTRTAQDATSPIAGILYYKSQETTALTEARLSELKPEEWKPLSSLVVKPNEKFTIYVKIMDMAGNTTYISTDGLIVEKDNPKINPFAPEITIIPEQPVNGFYNGDVQVDIGVTDDMENGSPYSGLKSISYRVVDKSKPKKDQQTQEAVLYSSDNQNIKKNQLKKKWSGEITVKSKLNNSNQVVIIVKAEDNAGNITTKRRTIKIDTTAPEVHISYDNNSPDSEKYYKSDRVATITVTERNFNPKDVELKLQNTEGSVPSISDWKEVKGTGNLDDTKHIATLTYHDDGDYTFGMDYSDLAANKCKAVVYADGTANPTEFTVDQTAPVITVSYDNNAAQNGKYFKEARTATVTITERNFDEGRVTFDNSSNVPAASWSSSGEVHTATFSYDTDGDYTFGVTMEDMAGNQSDEASYGDSVAGQAFTVDTSIEKPVIKGVENGKSYKEEIVPSISYGDENFGSEEIKLLRTRKDEKDIDVTKEFLEKFDVNGNGSTDITDSFEKVQENDGIYTLTVKISDLAGNEETSEVVFTVNRFGSVYVFDDYLISLKDAYTREVGSKLIITEYNPDRLIADSAKILISRDGTPLENVKYTVSPVINDKVEVGESGWYQYEYEIDTENFAADGIYNLAIASEDEAGNKPETTNLEDGDVLFHVDTTPPEITNISGLENAIVNAESQDVDFDVFDAIGLKKITVYVDEQEVGTYESFEDLANYSGSLTVAEGANQKIRLEVEDLAGNITDTDEKNESGEYLFQPEYGFTHKITVSTNWFVRWFANKVLFWGTIGAVTAASILLVIFIMWKKRKREA